MERDTRTVTCSGFLGVIVDGWNLQEKTYRSRAAVGGDRQGIGAGEVDPVVSGKKSTWASHPLDVDLAAVFTSFERAATVALIATFEPGLVCCDPADQLETVVHGREFADFDFIPVRRNGQIVGIVDRAEKARHSTEQAGRADELVEKAMCSLDESILISADASLLTFVASADTNPCRLVIRGTRINGIVTLSDLQKLPVRPVLFFLITHLEILMAEVLRMTYPNGDEWVALLTPPRRKIFEKGWTELQQSDLDLDKLTASNFADKKEALIRSTVPLPFGQVKAGKQLGRIERLRNGLAHAGKYAASRDEAQKCAETVRWVQQWIEFLSQARNRPAGTIET